MNAHENRRAFLKATTAVAASGLLTRPTLADDAARPIRVVVWDERQPGQKPAYEDFLGNAIADHLREQPGLSVKSVALDDPEQGLSDDVLDACDVLIWWGHARQAEVTPEAGRKIVGRILKGQTSLVALHSAHWSTPFVEAMNERARRDVERAFPDRDPSRFTLREVAPAKRYTVPAADAKLTPFVDERKYPDGKHEVSLHLPLCCFPAYRADGKPSTITVRLPRHPIAEGLPARFELPRTEMYDEPFHVPEPDDVILDECWATGEWFRSGMLWRLGKGRVFYFRPGHEAYSVFKQPHALKVVTNAARWLGGEASR